MANLGDVVLLAAPVGSGKSTLAQYLAQQLGSGKRQRGHLLGRARLGLGDQKPGTGAGGQRHVIDHSLTVCRSGRSVVLEFILYADHRTP